MVRPIVEAIRRRTLASGKGLAMGVYDAERQSAKADIEAAGVRATIRRGSTRASVSLLLLSYEAEERDGELIQFSDIKAMCPALGLDSVLIPNPETDRVVIESSDKELAPSVGDYRLVTSKPFMPNGVAIYFDLQIRK